MAIDKPTKPTDLMPRTFGGEKNNFSDDLIASGFEPNMRQTYDGDNLNYQLNATGKELDYCEKVVDYINGLGVGKTPIVNANNKLDETQVGLKVYSATETYSLGEWVRSGDKIYQSLTQGNLGNDLTNETYWKEVVLGGSGLELCDIGMALYVDETKGLRRYLNGQIVDINTNTQAFLNRLLEIKNTNPELFTTESNWQSEATLNIDGCVYKFVLNYSGDNVVSVRLPKYPDYVEIDAGDVAVKGNGMALGLTDGTNIGGMQATGGAGIYLTGGIGSENTTVGTAYSKSYLGTDKTVGIITNPTKSGIVGTLTQTKLKLRYFIQIATGSETENNIINDIELNNPYSLFDSKYSDHELNNLSWLKSEGQWNSKAVYPTAYDKLLKVYNGTETVEGLSVKLSTETYTDYDFVLNTANETFRLPLLDGSEDLISDNYNSSSFSATNDGYVLPINKNGQISIRIYGSFASDVTVLKNNKVVGTFNLQSSIYRQGTITTQVVKGDKIKVKTETSGVTATCNYLFFEAKGNGSLYFYVGETVQNANLIDAGRIGEQLANKQDKCIHITETYQNGTSWYRIYSDGWCEQGGQSTARKVVRTVKFVKPFVDANYYASATKYGNYRGTGAVVSMIATKSANSMEINNSSTDYPTCMWEAKGYIN